MSMIVPVFNGGEFINSFIKPFSCDRYHGELIFVDNGSTDGSIDRLEEICKDQCNWYVYSYNEIKSSYAARNYGAKYAKGRLLLFTDIDCVLTQSYFRFISNIKYSEMTLITGPTEIFFISENVYEVFDKFTYLTQKSYFENHYAATANLIVSASLYQKVGGFARFTSGADNLFSKNCFLHGGVLEFYDELRILHPPRSTKQDHLAKAVRLGIGHGELIKNSARSTFAVFRSVVKHVMLLIIPIHSFRLFFRVYFKKKWSLKEILKLLQLCMAVGFIQRSNILITLCSKHR